MKKLILFTLVLVLVGTAFACVSNEKKSLVWDNSSYYQPSSKVITEDQNAYFTSVNGIINYTDKKSKESYLLGEQSLSIEDVYKLKLSKQYKLAQTKFPFIFSYADYLYTVEASLKGDVDRGDQFFQLQHIDKTGKSKKNLLEFTNSFASVCLGEKAIYFIDKKYTADNQKILLVGSYNLEESKREEDLEISSEEITEVDSVVANQLLYYQERLYISMYTIKGNEMKLLVHIIDLANKKETSLLLADSSQQSESDELLRPSSFYFWQDQIVFNVSAANPSKDYQNFVYTSNLDGSDYQEWLSLPLNEEILSNGKKLVKINYKDLTLSKYADGEFKEEYKFDQAAVDQDYLSYALNSAGNLFQYESINCNYINLIESGKSKLILDLSEYSNIVDRSKDNE